MTRSRTLAAVALVLLTLASPPAAAAGASSTSTDVPTATVTVTDTTVEANGTVLANVTLERAPVDLAAYELTVTTGDTDVAVVDGAEPGQVPVPTRTRNLPDGGITVEGLDLAGDGEGEIAAGDEDVLLAQVRLRGAEPGTTDVNVAAGPFSARNSTPVDVVVGDATVDVEADDGPTGDVNGDGRVGLGDVFALFEQLVADDTRAEWDFNEDGRVGVGDVIALFDDYVAA